MEKKKEEYESLQIKVFSRWATNALLPLQITINDITTDFTDGVNLVKLAEVLTRKPAFRKWDPKPRIVIQKTQNCDLAIEMFIKDGVSFVNIGGKDIVDANKKLTLGLIWTLILKYTISEVQDYDDHQPQPPTQVNNEDNTSAQEQPQENKPQKPAEKKVTATQALMNWAVNNTHLYENIENFQPLPLAMCALLNNYTPDKIKFEKLNPNDNETNAKLAMETCEILGVPLLLDWEDLVNGTDDKTLFTQLSLIKKELKTVPRQIIEVDGVLERAVPIVEPTDLEKVLINWAQLKGLKGDFTNLQEIKDSFVPFAKILLTNNENQENVEYGENDDFIAAFRDRGVKIDDSINLENLGNDENIQKVMISLVVKYSLRPENEEYDEQAEIAKISITKPPILAMADLIQSYIPTPMDGTNGSELNDFAEITEKFCRENELPLLLDRNQELNLDLEDRAVFVELAALKEALERIKKRLEEEEAEKERLRKEEEERLKKEEEERLRKEEEERLKKEEEERLRKEEEERLKKEEEERLKKEEEERRKKEEEERLKKEEEERQRKEEEERLKKEEEERLKKEEEEIAEVQERKIKIEDEFDLEDAVNVLIQDKKPEEKVKTTGNNVVKFLEDNMLTILKVVSVLALLIFLFILFFPREDTIVIDLPLPYVFFIPFKNALETFARLDCHNEVLVIRGPKGIGKSRGLVTFADTIRADGRLVINFDCERLHHLSTDADIVEMIRNGVLTAFRNLDGNSYRTTNVKEALAAVDAIAEIYKVNMSAINRPIHDQFLKQVASDLSVIIGQMKNGANFGLNLFLECIQILSPTLRPIIIINSPDKIAKMNTTFSNEVFNTFVNSFEKIAHDTTNYGVIVEISDEEWLLSKYEKIDSTEKSQIYRWITVEEFDVDSAKQLLTGRGMFKPNQVQKLHTEFNGYGPIFAQVHEFMREELSFDDAISKAQSLIFYNLKKILKNNEHVNLHPLLEHLIREEEVLVDDSNLESVLVLLREGVVFFQDRSHVRLLNLAIVKTVKVLMRNSEL